ncbi:hypothetical protein K0M31_006978 [Melipona bicolor]|uniref:Uncharacterized protein n=1 Tax=Melipona bicolor TaxID=60889 RepID=A0AA40FRQ4_9HYME|nr:hypothetical protein K0M31_006978 [Melipona bicolor]
MSNQPKKETLPTARNHAPKNPNTPPSTRSSQKPRSKQPRKPRSPYRNTRNHSGFWKAGAFICRKIEELLAIPQRGINRIAAE